MSALTKNNIVLVGFMGTGKSTVGALTAERLGWTFADTDRWIEEKTGKTIPEIFAEQGEAAFREYESEALHELLGGKHMVLATGGGAVLAGANRACMLAGGLVVALTAPMATIIERVRGDSNRPLLQGDASERVRTLLEKRRGAYDFAHMTIDTADLEPAAVAARIVAALQAGSL
ncbi:shikimate kinase [Gordoniibacillus kamchatkensis]|uniref:Shikimate kinase n=1 Tax=Gordoniibacillus kamchatkensis TaxID=1590651 RepID=A0ABR5AJF7_9BACL|nr:shikimate kinase [Paenibacillus sp. VKM B-2647]KIL41177.1 shikimate kinase [Paenibacillus sp. VKM B-2647]